MPIRRHGAGWEVRIRSVKPEISRTFRSRGDAAEFERRTRQRIEDHRVGRLPAYSIEEALDRWLGGEAKSLRSFRNLQNKVRAIYPHIKGRPLTELADAAEDVIRSGHNLKPATVNRRLAILRRVGRLAFRKWQWLEHDEAGRIVLLPGEEPRYVQATQEQADRLLRAARGRPKAAILWGMMTGLRPSELRAVQPHDFKDGALLVTKTKTGKARRVPLAAGLRPEDFPYGLTEHDTSEGFREARAAAGMPWLQFRDLRRTFGSWIVQRTKSLKAAQDLLGHTTMTITARHYAHLLEGDLRAAVRKLPNFAGLARGKPKKKKAA